MCACVHACVHACVCVCQSSLVCMVGGFFVVVFYVDTVFGFHGYSFLC